MFTNLQNIFAETFNIKVLVNNIDIFRLFEVQAYRCRYMNK